MALHYVIDGYNAVNQIEQFIGLKLEDQRNQFIKILETLRPHGSTNNSITVVFDGKSGIYGDQSTVCVKVIFTKDETADDKIKRLVENSKNRKNIVVVTNDKEIKFYVRNVGAEVISVKQFLSKAKKTNSVSLKNGTVVKHEKSKLSNKNISKSLEHKITSEFEKIWLKKAK